MHPFSQRTYRLAAAGVALAFFSFFPGPAAGDPATDKIDLQVIKYKQLVEAVKAQRGKVVIVDVWGTFCIPCRKEFPNLVKMSRRYAGDGLVCMSVTVDKLDQREAALKFLQSKGATFANYLLDEAPEVWQKKWDVETVPTVFVFDRTGKAAAKFNSDKPGTEFTYADVEKVVQKALQEKP